MGGGKEGVGPGEAGLGRDFGTFGGELSGTAGASCGVGLWTVDETPGKWF